MKRWLRWPVRLAAAIGFLWVAASFTPLTSWWATRLAGRWNEPRGDTLVVLAGSEMEADILGASTYWRCVYALMYFRQGGIRRIILSGGGGQDRPVAEVMRMFLVGSGVPSGAILVETAALSTHDSARLVKPLLGQNPGQPVLLTSDYHMYRAWRAFQKQGVDLVPCPIPDVRKRATRWQRRWDAFWDLAVEMVKIGYYQARGWI